MKRILLPITILLITALLLMGCSDDDNNENSEKTTSSQKENASQQDNTEDSSLVDSEKDKSESATESEGTVTDEANQTPSNEVENETSDNVSEDEEESVLSEYTSEEIEYARVWLQVGANPDIDELNVRHIAAGELVNIHDDTSATYEEDVIRLEGSRMVDGSVTYSGNGDGTINVYNVPSHWASPAEVAENYMKEYTEEIIHNTELVAIDPGDDKEIEKYINMIHNRN